MAYVSARFPLPPPMFEKDYNKVDPCSNCKESSTYNFEFRNIINLDADTDVLDENPQEVTQVPILLRVANFFSAILNISKCQ